jgi:hypothetical protein
VYRLHQDHRGDRARGHRRGAGMKPPEDRVAAPTNGHHPALRDGDVETDLADIPEATDLGRGTPTMAVPGLRPAIPSVTPTQAAVGFGIIAALILLVLGRRRGGR